MPDSRQALRDFVATSNSGKYKNEDELMSKFPELKLYSRQALRDFVATSNSGKYKNEDELMSKFPELNAVKKKEPTESQLPPKKEDTGFLSKQAPALSLLDSSTPTKQKPSVSSGLKPVVNKVVVPKTSGAKAKYAAVTDEVYTNFPGKEKNEYRIIDDNWQKKEPNKEWVTIKHADAIINLNNQYKKTITPSDNFEKITSKVIDKSEEDVVPFLQNNYGHLGFSFQESGLGDRVEVMTDDGMNSDTFFLDNWTNDGDSSEALRLKAFLKENTKTMDREKYTKLDQEIDAINLNKQKKELPYDPYSVKNDAFSKQKAGLTSDVALPFEEQLKLKEKEKEAIDYNKGRMHSLIVDLNAAKKTGTKKDDDFVRARIAESYGTRNTGEIEKQNRYINNNLNDIARMSTGLKQRYDRYESNVDAFKSKLDQEGGIMTQELADQKAALEGEASLIDSEKKYLDENIDGVKKTSRDLNKISAEYLLSQESKGSTGGAMMNSFIKGATSIARFAGLEKSSQEELVKMLGSEYTTKEYMGSEQRSGFEQVLFGLSESIGALVSGGIAGKAASTGSFFSQSYFGMKDEINANPEFDKIPEGEKQLLSTVYGLTIGWLEKFGVDKIISKTPVGKTIMNKILTLTIKGLPKGAPAELIEQAVSNNVKALIAKGAINVAGGYLVEGTTEGLQDLAGSTIKEVYNAVKEKDLFNTPDSILASAWENAVLGGLGGVIMQTPIQAVDILKNGLSSKNSIQADIIEKSVSSIELKSMLVSKIKTQIINKDITKQEGEDQIKAINESASIFQKIPDGISDIGRAKSFDLLVERSNIEKEIEGKDVSLVAPQKARVAEINNELTKISEDATKKINVKEVSTVEYKGASEGQQEVGVSEGSQREVKTDEADSGDSTISGEVQQEKVTPESYVEELNKTIESDPETYWSVSPVDIETAKNSVIVGDSDGKGIVSKDGDIKGVFKSIQSKESGVADKILSEAVKAGGIKLDNFDGYLTKTYKKNGFRVVSRTPFNEEYAPNGWNKDKHGTPDVVAMIYDPEGKIDIEEKLFNDYDEAIAYRDAFVDEAKTNQKTAINVEQEVEAIGQLLYGTDQQIDQKVSKIVNKKIAKSVAKAAKAVSKIIPSTKFIVHDTDESYRSATKEEGLKQSSNGEFNAKTNTIHINGTSANARTVAHEVFHAILINKVKTDKNAADITKKMIEAVSSKVSTDINKKLNDFISNYDENIQNEEKLAELVGILAENYNSFSTSVKDIITRWIDKLASVLKLDPFNRNETYDVLNTIARKVAKGKVISDVDMTSIFGVTTNIVESTAPRKQVKVSKEQKLTFVTKEDLIDIDSLISDISSKNQKVWFWTADQLGRGNYFDSVLDGEHFLDAGPSFALDPENRDNNIIWASGANKKTLENNIAKSDYIFIISGSPQKSKLFNKTVTNLIRRRIEGTVKFNDFKKELLEAKPTSKIKLILEKYNSYEDLFMGADRKNFIIAINEQQIKNTPAKKVLEKYNAFVDPNDLRDGFYQDNNFEMGDVMLVLKADKLGEKSKHSTYETDILGSVIGVPNKVVNAYDIMPSEIKDKYRDDMSRSEQSQVVAPYGIGIKEISPNINTSESLDIENIIRKQKPKTINDIVKLTKDQGFSDAAIRQYLKEQGYTDKQATASINEYNVKKEGIFVKRDGGVPTRIADSIKSFKRRMFSARAFLPKSVFTAREDKEANVARHLNIVDQNVKDFNRLYSKYKGDKDDLVDNFDKYIRGDKDAVLPYEFLVVANSMRNQIDGLSMQLINSGLVDESMAKKIKDNMGQYLTRSYKIYDRANWKKEVQDEVKQNAINLLKYQYRDMAQQISDAEGIQLDEALDNLVTNRLDEMLTTDGASNFITGSKLGAKDLSVLKKLNTEIPVEIRMLLGEYSDPALNYAKTVLKLSSLAANHKFLTEIKKNGMGVYFFEKNDPRRPKDFNTKIATEGSKTMEPLNLLYTTKEIAGAFMAQPSQLSDFWKTFMKFQSSIRWLKTIGSVATHIKNVFGNLGFVWINAHFDPKEAAKAFMTVKNDFSKGTNQQRRDKMNNYISLGIVKQSAGLGEIMDMFKDANWDTAMASRLSNEKIGLIGKAKRLFFQGKKKIEDAYQAEDDFFKVVAYENELSRYSKAMFNKPKTELTEDELAEVNKIVTEIVKNTYPTYDRIPEAIKMVRRAPFIGNFVSFQAESYRTAFNTIALAKNEITSKNKSIQVIGAQRLAGATTYLSAKSAILAYFSMAAGTGLTGFAGYLFDDDDEEQRDKDIREFVAPWSKKSDLLMISVGSGKVRYIDFSSSDPHGALKKVMNAFFLGETTIEGFSSGVVETFSPFIGEDMTVEALLALKNNQDKYGNPIYNSEESLYDQSQKVLAYMYKLVEPGTFSSIRRGWEAEDKANELVANLTGFRTYDVDVNQQFGYKMKDLSDRISNAKKIYNSKYYNEKATDADKKTAYNKSNEALKKIYTDVISVYNSAERLGCNPEDLGITMKDFGGMSKENITEIQSGKIPKLKKKDEEDKVVKYY